MTAARNKPATGKKRSSKKLKVGRMPTKRSINLVLVDENKINIGKAVLGVLAILVLAALFSKYLVYDRLAAVSAAQSRVSRLEQTLSEGQALLNSFGDVENDFAHYTVQNMTPEEMGLVDRPEIMRLVASIIEDGKIKFDADEFNGRLSRVVELLRAAHSGELSPGEFSEQVEEERLSLPRVEVIVHGWSVTGNVLTVELTGISLERLNLVARELENSPIVDSCIISTANKDVKNAQKAAMFAETDVWARLIVYLQQPPKEVAEP